MPQHLLPGGLIVLRDGETVEEAAILLPLAWAIEHRAEVEIIVAGATPAARAILLDALLADIAAAITANRTLGGVRMPMGRWITWRILRHRRDRQQQLAVQEPRLIPDRRRRRVQ